MLVASEPSHSSPPPPHPLYSQHPDNLLLHPHSDSAHQMCGPPSLGHHNRGINPYLGFDYSSLLSASVAAAAVAASTSPMPMAMSAPVTSSPSRMSSFPTSGCFLGQSEHNMHPYHVNNGIIGHHSSSGMDPDPLISVGSAFLGMGTGGSVGVCVEKDESNNPANSDDSGSLLLPIHPDRDL